MGKKISIYIDGANFYGGLNSINPKYTDEKFDFEKYVKTLIKEDWLVCVYYYNGYAKKKINPTVWERQKRLFSRLRKYEKFKVVLCRKQKVKDEEGKHYFKLKEDDINLAVNALSDAYENKYNKMVLISSDSDFIPLIKQIKKLKKEVEICYFKSNVRKGLLNLFPEDNRRKITKKIIKKFFWKG